MAAIRAAMATVRRAVKTAPRTASWQKIAPREAIVARLQEINSDPPLIAFGGYRVAFRLSECEVVKIDILPNYSSQSSVEAARWRKWPIDVAENVCPVIGHGVISGRNWLVMAFASRFDAERLSDASLRDFKRFASTVTTDTGDGNFGMLCGRPVVLDYGM